MGEYSEGLQSQWTGSDLIRVGCLNRQPLLPCQSATVAHIQGTSYHISIKLSLEKVFLLSTSNPMDLAVPYSLAPLPSVKYLLLDSAGLEPAL